MEFLAKEIRLLRKQNLGTFDFAEIETLGGDLLRCDHHWVGVGLHEFPELLACRDDLLKRIFFLRLKRERSNLHLPVLEVFQLGTSCITGDLHSPVADGARIFVVFLEFSAGDFEAFAVIPAHPINVILSCPAKQGTLPFMT